MLTEAELKEFADEAAYRTANGERTGQALMNALVIVNPEAADIVSELGADPYYDDTLIPKFMELVMPV